MTNQRLRSALKARRLTVDDVAGQLKVDPRTVDRWLDGRVPYPKLRWQLADLVGQDEAVLWPDAEPRPTGGPATEVTHIYARRADVPRELWWVMLTAAVREVSVLAYAATFLPENNPRLIDHLREKGARGCQVRIALGDPASPRLREREAEERFGEGIVSRARVALTHYEPLVGAPGIEIRVHGTTLYNSIFRFDDAMLVNTHVFGRNAYDAPVLELHRLTPGGLFDKYASSVDEVWAHSSPTHVVVREEKPSG